jgi:Zn-dependent oligopeptidase
MADSPPTDLEMAEGFYESAFEIAAIAVKLLKLATKEMYAQEKLDEAMSKHKEEIEEYTVALEAARDTAVMQRCRAKVLRKKLWSAGMLMDDLDKSFQEFLSSVQKDVKKEEGPK